MNIETIEMSREKAREIYATYRKGTSATVNEHQQKMHDGLQRAHKFLAEGYKLLDIETAFRTAGHDGHGRPNIALVRANAEVAYCGRRRSWGNEDPVAISQLEAGPDYKGNQLLTYNTVRLPPRWILSEGEKFGWTRNGQVEFRRGSCPVPVVPIHLIPKGGLNPYHILFEARWEDLPDRDPLLLKHCYGSLFAIVAEWDLTDLEMAVLKNAIS